MSDGFQLGSAKEIESVETMSMVSSVFRKKGKPVVLVALNEGIHAGHYALIRAARSIPGAVVVVAVRVGVPTEKLAEERVDVVFRYTDELLWPAGLRTQVSVMDHGLEPVHDLNVEATRLLTLLGIVGPSDLIVGEKDYEFAVASQQMITDFHLGVKVHSVPTVRMPNGLALSLRNSAVAADAHDRALALSAALTAGAHAAAEGAEAVLSVTRSVLDAAGITPDYVELRSRMLTEAPERGEARLLVAAEIGGVRLIDSVGVPIGIGFENLGDAEQTA